MNYRLTIDSTNYHIGALDSKSKLIDRIDKVNDHEGFEIEFNNVFLDDIHLKWGKYSAKESKNYSVTPERDTIVAHFCLLGSCITEGNNKLDIQRGECLLFKEEKSEYSYQMGTDNSLGSFFEISLDTDYFTNLFIGEDILLDSVMNSQKLFASLTANPNFYSIISEMQQNKANYSGKFKRLYLESKVMELLLLQFSHLTSKKTKRPTLLLTSDIEAIHYVKKILDSSLEHTPIPELALKVGINQTKLKAGFKELFGKTIFEYLTYIRMNKANELLKNTEFTIGEIAEKVGYKHSQHFSTAFQRNFGFTPSQFR